MVNDHRRLIQPKPCGSRRVIRPTERRNPHSSFCRDTFPTPLDRKIAHSFQRSTRGPSWLTIISTIVVSRKLLLQRTQHPSGLSSNIDGRRFTGTSDTPTHTASHAINSWSFVGGCGWISRKHSIPKHAAFNGSAPNGCYTRTNGDPHTAYSAGSIVVTHITYHENIHQLTQQFAQGRHVTPMTVGRSARWSIAPSLSTVPAQPRVPNATTPFGEHLWQLILRVLQGQSTTTSTWPQHRTAKQVCLNTPNQGRNMTTDERAAHPATTKYDVTA